MYEFITQHWEIISGTIAFIAGFVNFLYCKSEKFFLFVNRIILNFKKYKIPIYLDAKISLTSSLNEDEVKKLLKKLTLSNNEYIPFKIKVNTSIGYDETKILILIQYRSFLAKIEDDKEIIREKTKEIIKETNSKLTNIDIDINFESGKNPYEGLFVKKLPVEKIKNFSVKVELNSSLIEAKKDKIKLRSKNLDSSLFILDKLIYLKIPVFER